MRNEHHVIPRSAGGEDGPQCSLCTEHHNKLHRIAECLPKKPFREWLAGENPERTKKLLWLATRVSNAFEAYRADPNRHVLMSMMLDPKLRQEIEMLKPILGVKSREAIIRFAVASLHKRHFPQSR